MRPSPNGYHKPKKEIIIPDRVAERAATRYVEVNGCWISTYSVASHGYAQIGWRSNGEGHVVTAHRAAWVFANGRQIQDGGTVDHTCKNKLCVNPSHLREITNFENARRTFGSDWPLGECKHGHPNSELYWDGSRYRCKPCTLEKQRRYREKKKAERHIAA